VTGLTARGGSARIQYRITSKDEPSAHEIELGDDALAAILREHGTWVESGGAAGARAELAGTRLSGRAFWRADLRRAGFSGTLRTANSVFGAAQRR